MPRRRVSVAVVPKFNLLNIPGQTLATAGPGSSAGPTASAALPVLCEANDMKGNASTEAAQPAAECGKSASEQENEPAKPSVNLEEIRAEIKAKIEEEAYQKGYQDGLRQSKALQEEKCEEESAAEKLLEAKNKDEESGKRLKNSRRMEEVLAVVSQFCPKSSVSRRLLWITLTLFVAVCVIFSICSFFSDYYSRHEDT